MVVIITVYDKKTQKGGFNNNGLCVLDECISVIISQNLNGDYSLELTYPVISEKAKYLDELNIIKALNQLFRIYKVERSQTDNLKINVWARHIFYDLSFYFIESAKIVNANLAEAIEFTIPPEVQADYKITAFNSTVAPFAVSQINSVDALFRLIEVYGGELVRDNFNIDLQERIGGDTGVQIRYGKNIKGLTVTMDSSAIATRIFPVGDSELLLPERYIEIKGVKPLPFDITKKVEFKECKDVESLRAKATKYAESSAIPKMNVAIDFVELSKISEYEHYKALTNVNLGDYVTVFHEKLNVKTSLRVIKRQIDLLNPVNTKIELGDPLDTIIEKLDTSKLLDEIKNMIDGNKSGLVIKTNSDTLTITTTKTAVMVIGLSTKADTNLNCTITLTGKAMEDTTLSILFSLDGVYYDLKPIQKLAKGDNVLGFTLPMPQVSAGSHSFIIEMFVSNDTFVIEKNNLQVSIEGLNIEGGLSATLPRIEVIYTFLYSLFLKKFEIYNFDENYQIRKPYDDSVSEIERCYYSEFKDSFGNYASNVDNRLINVLKVVKGIIEEFSRRKSLNYKYDDEWVNWDSDFDAITSSTFDSYNRATIVEPIFTNVGDLLESESGVVFEVNLTDRNKYRNLVSIGTKLIRNEVE